MTAFDDGSTPFRAFLSAESHPAAGESRFRARNFRLDERVDDRADSYEASGPSSWTRHTWVGHHLRHLRLRTRHAPGSLPQQLDPARPGTFAESFGTAATRARLDDDQRYMVHVSRIDAIRPDTGEGPDVVLEVVTRAIAGDSAAARRFEHLAGTWRRDTRPVFATLYDNVADLLPDDPAHSPSGWEDGLRDRLGLAQHDGAFTPIDIVVYRYRVRDLPKMRGARGVRPTHYPTVLDGDLNPAFCPAPGAEVESGFAVALDPNAATPPAPELIHPPVSRLLASMLFRVGQIRTAPPRGLDFARGWHLDCLRGLSGSSDFGHNTDADIL